MVFELDDIYLFLILQYQAPITLVNELRFSPSDTRIEKKFNTR